MLVFEEILFDSLTKSCLFSHESLVLRFKYVYDINLNWLMMFLTNWTVFEILLVLTSCVG